MSNQDQQITSEFILRIREKLFEEFWPRLLHCLSECDEDLLWFRPNEKCNSIGNQVLHLEGNVRQWMLHGISGAKDVRIRDEEFNGDRRVPKEELVKRIQKLKEEVEPALASVTSENVLEHRKIQYFNISVLGALLNVTEHFSYHLGQISYIVKSQKNIDLGYYSGKDLN